MKISVDFDGTLERKYVQTYIKELIEQGIEVHITTSRYEDTDMYLPIIVNHDDLYKIAKELKIETINFTNFQSKYIFLKNKEYLFHIDDDKIELLLMHHNAKAKGINVLLPDWKKKCNKLIENYNKLE